MEKLPKAFKKKWLKALRSGEYKQGMGELYDAMEDTYCCLGVACKVSGHPVPDDTFIDGSTQSHGFKKVPTILRGSYDIPLLLSQMNDHDHIDEPKKYGTVNRYKSKRSFKQIANWIEKNL